VTQSIDVIKYAGEVNFEGYEAVCRQLRESKRSDSAVLVLATPGGDPHAGFRIGRALQHAYGHFDALIPRMCKSAGTLIITGARTIFLDDMSELGPLDVQVKKGDEVIGRSSGLDIFQAVNFLQNQAMISFQGYLMALTSGAGLSTKVASEIATKLTTGLLEPIAAQIDPVKLAEMQRATNIALEYGDRLNERSQNLTDEGLYKLVNGYPSHGFVIDRKEARKIFKRVCRPEGQVQALSDDLHNELGSRTYLRNPWVALTTLGGAPNATEAGAQDHVPDSPGPVEGPDNRVSEELGEGEATGLSAPAERPEGN
jgi:Serine dehydrogenase proteinase